MFGQLFSEIYFGWDDMNLSFGISNKILCCAFCSFLILNFPSSSLIDLKFHSQVIEKNRNMDLAEVTDESPPALYRAAMAYDAESDRVVVFGGSSDTSDFTNETWSYDYNTNTWTNMTPSNSPHVRGDHEMVYDSESDLIILYGGWYGERVSSYYLTDTWTYDLNSNTWTEMFPSTCPGWLYRFSMTYESKADRVILFHGDETWTYDVDTNIWEKKSPENYPQNHFSSKIVYDENSELVILLGLVIISQIDTGYPETWVYNLTSNVWTKMTPENQPSYSDNCAMTYDHQSDRVILFLGETWSYDLESNQWMKMSPRTQPEAQSETCMVYDSESGRIILFGGIDVDYVGNLYDDTWAYSYHCDEWWNMAWHVQRAKSPPAVASAAMAYDSESDRVVLFGGKSGHSGVTDETWCYDYNSNTWMNMTPSNSPHFRYYHQMVYDSQSDLIILYGGSYDYGWMSCELNDTWTYDLNSNTWTEMFPSTCPGTLAFPGHGMTYDSKADRVIFFHHDETWTYDVDTNTWENMNPETYPQNHNTFNLAYDKNAELCIYCGRSGDWGAQIETWVYDFTSNVWTEMTSENQPPYSTFYEITYDSQADRTILFFNETWSYDLDSNLWIELNPKNHPKLWLGSSMAYDSESKRIILFGGRDIEGQSWYSDDTWVYLNDSNEWWNMEWYVPDDETFCFIAYGDTRGEHPDSVSSLHDDIVSLYIQHDPELVIHTGDMVNHGGETYQWPFFNESISSLWHFNIPMYGTVGNHELYTDDLDVQDDDLSNYQDFFDFSNVIEQLGETELYYSFDSNGIHFIFLNTAQEWDEEDYTCPTAQMTWLEDDLAGNHEFIVVSFHYPAWSIRADRPDRWATAESIRETFHDMFVEYGVDIVFNGHDHLYYRTVRDGIYYVVTGGGGAPLAEIQKEWTVWQTGDVGFSDYHYCVAKPTNGFLEVDVFLLNGTIADSYTVGLPLPVTPFYIPEVILRISLAAVVVIVFILIIRVRGNKTITSSSD